MSLKQEDYIYYLHKTSTDDPAVIEDIFNNGLKSWYGYSMHSTLAPIDTETLQKVGLEQVIMNYLGDSEDYNSVIVVKMPKDYMTAIVHRDGKVNPPVPVWKSNDDGTTSFTPQLIQGIYCKRVNKSFSNPNFSPVYDPTGLKYSDEQINYMWSGQLENWVSFAKSRTNLDYQTLCRTDNQNQNWTRLIQHYSNKFGVNPINPTVYSMSEADVQLLNSVRNSSKKI